MQVLEIAGDVLTQTGLVVASRFGNTMPDPILDGCGLHRGTFKLALSNLTV